jgi:hypothetical protein
LELALKSVVVGGAWLGLKAVETIDSKVQQIRARHYFVGNNHATVSDRRTSE